MVSYRAAIDFGTSYTAATSRTGSPSPAVLVLVDDGRLSSAVALDDDGRLRAGPSVEEVAAFTPDRVERTPKRCLDQRDVILGGQQVLTVNLVATVLEYVRAELLQQFNGREPDDLCLTHPARWEVGDAKVQRLEEAAREAGFAGVRLLPEPCAAALALAADGRLDDVRTGKLVAVYDLGGGTFDMALLGRVPGGGFELTGEPEGDQSLGGEWLDDRLYERLSSRLPSGDEQSLRDPDGSADPLRWRQAGFAFRQAIRRAKESLSREASARITLFPPFSLSSLVLTRADLELVATPMIEKSADRFELFLRHNGRTAADLAAICLVGGSSRLTVVNRIIGRRFGPRIVTHGDPKAVTAIGALCEVQAAPVNGDRGHPPPEVETWYVDALAAFWTDKFDRAVELIQRVLDAQPDYPEAGDKLEEARRQQQLSATYRQASAAADAEDWKQAVEGFTRVRDIEPGYRDVAVRLEHAREQQQIAALRAEARRLYEAGQWAAVVKVGDRLRELSPHASGLDDLMTSAQTELASAERAEQTAKDYGAALRMFDAGAWQQAAGVLEQIAQENPGYRDTSALLARARSMAGQAGQPVPETRVIGQPAVVRTFRADYASANSVAFSADGRWLAGSASDGKVRVWEAATGQPQFAVEAYAWAVLFSSDGRWLVTNGTRTAQIWDIATRRQSLRVDHKSSRDHAVALTLDGNWLATTGLHGDVSVWDAGDGQRVTTISVSDRMDSLTSYGVAGLDFSPDGRWLAVASTDTTARIWDVATGQSLLTVTHQGAVSALAFSPDGRWLATASADKTARISDTATGQSLLTVTHHGAVSALAFSPDGRWLATASADKTARISDTATGRMLAELRHKKAVRAVAFSPDGDHVATASKQSAQIWALKP